MKSIKALSALAVPVLTVAAAAFSEVSAQDASTVNYYLRAPGYYADLTDPSYSKSYWSLSDSEQITPDSLPGADAAVEGINL